MTATNRILLKKGYDFAIKRTFYLDGVAENLSAATIKASLLNEGKTSELIADVTQTDGGGATWSSGVVIIRFTAAQTAAGISAAGNGHIEVSVVVGGIRYAYEDIPVAIEIGYSLS